MKRASVERVSDLVGQLNATLQSFIGKTEQNKASLLTITNEKVMLSNSQNEYLYRLTK